MFVLAEIQENIRLQPKKLRHDFVEAVRDALDAKYSNKVVVGLGLCVAVFDILELDDPYVHPGEANAFVKVKFRLIVMRPVEGEVLLGTIRQCTPEGVHVSLGFFDDILLPGSCLQPGSLFDAAEQVWVWNYGASQLFMDVGEAIRFRLLEQHFIEEAPVRKEVLMAAKMAAMNPGAAPQSNPVPAEAAEEPGPEQSPFRLVGSIAEDGLGLVSWWGQ